MALQYKCPDCGAFLEYDPITHMLLCSSCGLVKPIEQLQFEKETPSNNDNSHFVDETITDENIDEVYGDFDKFEEQTTSSTYGEEETSYYTCQSCGAKLITTPDTTALTCSYCNSPVILDDRLSGDMAPSRIIPFKLTREQAEEEFKKWRTTGIITPNKFNKGNQLKSITGLYVPFWLFDLNCQGEVFGTGTKKKTYTDGDYKVTDIMHFNIYRKATLDFDLIPLDASEKMSDDLMGKLEPFQYEDLTDFQTPFLSGYIAENHNYTDKQLFPKLVQDTNNYMDSYIKATIKKYSNLTFNTTNYNTKQRNAYYTLLPVWMFTYSYKGKDYTFAMNGQTGKVAGNPPISIPKFLIWWLVFSGVFFGLVHFIYMICGGGL